MVYWLGAADENVGVTASMFLSYLARTDTRDKAICVPHLASVLNTKRNRKRKEEREERERERERKRVRKKRNNNQLSEHHIQ